MKIVAVVLNAILLLVACADTRSFPDTAAPLELGAPDLLPGEPYRPVLATLQGKVLAPDGKMPVAGALLYLTSKPPSPIPDQVFCDKCVELTKGTPNTTSAPDGSFQLEVSPGSWLLVTQKGAFRRVRQVEVPAAGMTVPAELTTLPARTDPSLGDTIPRMAVIEESWDAIQNSLAKLGLGSVDAKGVLVRGSESFTMHTCQLVSIWPPRSDCKPVDPCDLLQKPEEISKYHIVFVPCGSEGLNGCFASPAAAQTLRDYVKAGGRLYVTDWHYDLIHTVFPGYIHWVGESSQMDSAQLMQPYNAPAIVDDPDLKSWLAAQSLSSFDLLESYTIIDNIAKQPTPGPDAKSDQLYNLGPYTWMSGQVPGKGVRPMTVTFPYGCGKVLFSTYHTEGEKSGAELLPQERALLYVILEVAVCMKDPVPD